jgi:hypothetical protein
MNPVPITSAPRAGLSADLPAQRVRAPCAGRSEVSGPFYDDAEKTSMTG